MPPDVPHDPHPRPPDWVGLAGAALTVGLHFALHADRPSVVFIAGACVFWAGYIAVRAIRDPGVFRAWGFRSDNLVAASAIPAALFIVAAAAFAAYAAWRGQLRLPAHLPLLFLLYPVWGVIQQFLVLGVLVGNLERLPAVGGRRWMLVVPVAVVFGLVHIYDLRLVPATCALELVLIPLYFRHRNLWPLGVLHGWLGGLFYLWVLHRDLWAESFG